MKISVYQVVSKWFLENGGQVLAETHLNEVGNGMTAIDYETYFQLEEAGTLLILVACDHEMQIKGYVIGTANPSIHSAGEWVFNTTSFYCVPELRKTGVSKQLFKSLRSYCKSKGVKEIVYSVNEGHPQAHEFAKALGMRKIETWYSIYTEEE